MRYWRGGAGMSRSAKCVNVCINAYTCIYVYVNAFKKMYTHTHTHPVITHQIPDSYKLAPVVQNAYIYT